MSAIETFPAMRTSVIPSPRHVHANDRARRGGARIRLLLVIVVVALIGAIVLWRVLVSPPSWFAPPDVMAPVVRELADRVELRVLEVVHAEREEDEPWGVRVTDEQLNAWLAVKLRPWLVHEGITDWPEEIGVPQVHFNASGLHIGVDLRAGDHAGSVLVLRVQPSVEDEGLRLRLDRVQFGRLPLPGEAWRRLADLLRDHLAEDAAAGTDLERLLSLLRGEEAIDPTITLADGRRVRLVALRLGRNEAFLTCRTLSSDEASALDDE